MKKKSSDTFCNSNMTTEYQNDIKKKKESGQTEGQAVLEWLEENQNKNKPKEIKK